MIYDLVEVDFTFALNICHYNLQHFRRSQYLSKLIDKFILFFWGYSHHKWIKLQTLAMYFLPSLDLCLYYQVATLLQLGPGWITSLCVKNGNQEFYISSHRIGGMTSSSRKIRFSLLLEMQHVTHFQSAVYIRCIASLGRSVLGKTVPSVLSTARGLRPKLNLNEILQIDTRGFNAAFSHWIPSVSVVQFTVQMSKLNGLGKTHLKHLCSRTENFAHPITTNKLFESV